MSHYRMYTNDWRKKNFFINCAIRIHCINTFWILLKWNLILNLIVRTSKNIEMQNKSIMKIALLAIVCLFKANAENTCSLGYTEDGSGCTGIQIFVFIQFYFIWLSLVFLFRVRFGLQKPQLEHHRWQNRKREQLALNGVHKIQLQIIYIHSWSWRYIFKRVFEHLWRQFDKKRRGTYSCSLHAYQSQLRLLRRQL